MPDADTTFNLDVVFEAARAGLPVFPIKSGGKRPSVDAFYDFASTDPSRITYVFNTAFPGRNVGVSTDRLLVIDVDTKEGRNGWHSLEALEQQHGQLPRTVRAVTASGGAHFYFRIPDGHPPTQNSQSKIGEHLDVRGYHGYVVAPPSIVTEGDYPGAYAWFPGLSPADLPIAVAPQWLVDLAGAATPRERSDEPDLVEPDTVEAQEEATWYLAEIPPASIHHGSRHHDAYVRACMLRSFGISEDTAVELMAELWAPKCVPPATAEETEKEVRQAYKYAKGRFGDAHPTVTANRLAARDAGTEAQPDEEFEAAPLDPSLPGPKPKAPLFFTIGQRFNGAPVPREWIVPNWIPAGEVVSLYGDGGLGKTELAQQLAYAAHLGSTWLGMPVIRQRTWAVLSEDDANELHRRHARLIVGLGLEFEEHRLSDLRITARDAQDKTLLSFDSSGKAVETLYWKRLKQAVLDDKIQLLILDPLAVLFGGSEINRLHVNAFVRVQLAGLIEAAKTRGFCLTVFLLAHPSLSGMSSGSGLSGSTDWNNAVRARLYLRKDDEERARASDRVLSRLKGNYAVDSGAGGTEDDEIRLERQGGVLAVRGARSEDEWWPEPDTLAMVRDIIASAWRDGAPLSMAPQTRQTGRYAPRVIHARTGMELKEAIALMEDWLEKGVLVVEERDAKSHVKGLRLVDGYSEKRGGES